MLVGSSFLPRGVALKKSLKVIVKGIVIKVKGLCKQSRMPKMLLPGEIYNKYSNTWKFESFIL